MLILLIADRFEGRILILDTPTDGQLCVPAINSVRYFECLLECAIDIRGVLIRLVYTPLES